MAFTKSIKVPGYGFTAHYIRVDRIDYLDELSRDLQFQLKLYANKETAATPGCQGFTFAVVRVLTDSFDKYFAKKILQAKGAPNIYQQCYTAVLDVLKARQLRDAWDAEAGVRHEYAADSTKQKPKAKELTPEQTKLIATVLLNHAFGAENDLSGVKDA